LVSIYSLSPASVDFARTPDVVKRGLARHDVPVLRRARLAADRKAQGQGSGGVALVIDAKNERAARWYVSYGAVPMVDAPLTLLLPLATIDVALK
jgi:hypothetical protein